MKKLMTAFIALTLLALNAKGQTKNVELYDLLRMFAPDSASSLTTNNWKTGAGADSPVKWKNSNPIQQGKQMVKSGDVNMLINGKPSKCIVLNGMEGETKPCKWSITLSGQHNGYDTWAAGTFDFDEGDHTRLIENLFGKKLLKATLVKKDEMGASMWNYLYEIKMPGKRKFYLMIDFAAGGAASGFGSSFTLICSADKSKVAY